MIALKILITCGLLSLVKCQQDVFTAYSPAGGQYGGGPLYSPRVTVTPQTPRLVPIKVNKIQSFSTNLHHGHSHGINNNRHLYGDTYGAGDNRRISHTDHGQRRRIQNYYDDGHGSFDVVGSSGSRHVRITQAPAQLHHYHYGQYHQERNDDGHGQGGRAQQRYSTRVKPPPSEQFYRQSGEPIRVKRIRVAAANPQAYAAQPSPYATTLAQPIQFRHTEPAVATYKPALAYQPQQSAPQYYPAAPVAPRLQRPAGLKVQSPIGGGQKTKEEQLEDEYPSDPNPQYNFAFDVKDDDFTNYQNRQEQREGGVTKGSYSVVDPDGYVRTVTYEASPTGGFKAKVTREPTDVKIKFPEPTLAPQEDASKGVIKSGPSYSQGTPLYSQYQPQYQAQVQPQQPQYVARGGRFPSQHRLLPQYSQ